MQIFPWDWMAGFVRGTTDKSFQIYYESLFMSYLQK